jgi:hypothetical protein
MNCGLHVYRCLALKLVLLGGAELLSIFAAMLPAAEAAGSIPFQRVVWNQFAVPVRVEVCVPARSLTETVAFFTPVG